MTKQNYADQIQCLFSAVVSSVARWTEERGATTPHWPAEQNAD